MGVSGRPSSGQSGTLRLIITWLLFSIVPPAQTSAPAPGAAKTFSSDPGPGQVAGLQGIGGSSLVKLVNLQSLDQTVSDQQGIYSLTKLGGLDYIVSSVPLSADEYSSAKEPLAQIPFLFSPLAIIYTYPGGVNITLNLDASVLSQIFTCSITNYNNASIKALNPGIDLPARQFRPVAGSFDDSNTKILSRFVWGVDTWSPQCVSVTQTATTADWLNPLSQVSLVAGRIGFVPYASVVAANTPEYSQQLAEISVGAIRNPNGTYVAPSASAPFPFALSALPQSVVSSQWADLNASASALPKAYAIGQLAYFITTANLGANGLPKGSAMRGILQDLLSDSYQSSLPDKGGVPLPQDVLVNLRQQVQNLQNVPPPPPPASGSVHSGNALKIGLAVGIPCASAVAAAGVLIWWCCLRRRKTSALSTTTSAKVHRELAAQEGNLLSTEDIMFEKDERGKRLLLGEGAFAKGFVHSKGMDVTWKLCAEAENDFAYPLQVFKAQWNGAEAAVKILHDQGEKQKAEFLHEATMLKGLRHPNVVDYFGLAFSERDEMMLVMEFVGGGNLAKNLSTDKTEPRKLGWYRNGRFVLLGVARGLAFMHSRNVIVFDIKAGNVMLDQDGVTAKITDMGLSKILAGSNTATLLRGTLAYMSPELFGAYSTTTNGPVKAPVTQAVDVYSFGVLMWEVLSGEKPSRTTSLRKIRVPEECPPEVEALRRRCMSRDPKDRPTAAELMNELDALARMKSNPGRMPATPYQTEPYQNPVDPPAPGQPPRRGQHLARISSGLMRLASAGRDQVQALGRKSAAPCNDSGAKMLGTLTSGRESAPLEKDRSPV